MENPAHRASPETEAFLAQILDRPDPKRSRALADRLLGRPDRESVRAFVASILTESNYNPNEPRDERGRWTTGGSRADALNTTRFDGHADLVRTLFVDVPGAAEIVPCALGDPSATEPPAEAPPWRQNNRPGTRRQGRFIGGGDPAWRGPIAPTHEFVFTMDEKGDVHTYSWGNEARSLSNPSRWFHDYPHDITAATLALSRGGLSLGPVEGGESLNQYIDEAYGMLHGAGEASPSNHANGGVAANCKSEAQRLLTLAKALQAADRARPQDRELLRERAKVDAGLTPPVKLFLPRER